jgi:hypothetical protein
MTAEPDGVAEGDEPRTRSIGAEASGPEPALQCETTAERALNVAAFGLAVTHPPIAYGWTGSSTMEFGFSPWFFRVSTLATGSPLARSMTVMDPSLIPGRFRRLFWTKR